MTAFPCWSTQFPRAAEIYFSSVCLNPICRWACMPLYDMKRAGVARERTARRRRTGHRLREIIGAGTHLCEFLGDAGFDVRIGGTGTARRRQRELARYALRMLERRLRILIVLATCRIMDSKDFEGRLIDQDLDSLRNHSGDSAHR